VCVWAGARRELPLLLVAPSGRRSGRKRRAQNSALSDDAQTFSSPRRLSARITVLFVLPGGGGLGVPFRAEDHRGRFSANAFRPGAQPVRRDLIGPASVALPSMIGVEAEHLALSEDD
jgi:hypothetical protein